MEVTFWSFELVEARGSDTAVAGTGRDRGGGNASSGSSEGEAGGDGTGSSEYV